MKLMNLLAVTCVLGIVGALVIAEDASPKPKFDGVRGQIVKVDGANVTIKTWAGRGGEAKEVVVATDDKTVVTIDEKEAKVADLKADMFVMVTPAQGTATKIVASTKKLERRKPATDKAETK